jgi:hypothetical protein
LLTGSGDDNSYSSHAVLDKFQGFSQPVNPDLLLLATQGNVGEAPFFFLLVLAEME